MISIILALLTLLSITSCSKPDHIKDCYLASETEQVQLYTINQWRTVTEAQSVVRGGKVEANFGHALLIDEVEYIPVGTVNEEPIYAKRASLVFNHQEVTQERVLYVRTPASIITDRATSRVGGQTFKGEAVRIVGFDSLRTDGRPYRYKVQQDSIQGYIYSKYLVSTYEEATKHYEPEKYDKLHKAIRNSFGGGEAIGCDFHPTERVEFPNNKMPEACYSLYLNISPSVLNNIEAYISFAKETKINTFIIDIKDNECPGYKAEAMKRYSPTNYERAEKGKERMYHRAVKRLHEEGFYVVGRITCFKDSYFVKDHPEVAITDKATGKPFKHNKAYWPSAYDRRVWQFNIELAKEAVRTFGFNEINFDYVRFPDRMTKVERRVNYNNIYNESKVQAIQRFVQYACDELHAIGAYVSIDVFGEAANPGYTTAYGQYWPAISNICDVICGMPYPDHFTRGYYGIAKPWNSPYQIMKAWGNRVQQRQAATPTPAKVRTWIQAYPVMSHIDSLGLRYNAADVEREIRGLYAAGLLEGFATWHSGSRLEKYKAQKAAYCIDYLQEHRAAKDSNDEYYWLKREEEAQAQRKEEAEAAAEEAERAAEEAQPLAETQQTATEATPANTATE